MTTPVVSEGKRQHLQKRIYLDNFLIFNRRWAEPCISARNILPGCSRGSSNSSIFVFCFDLMFKLLKILFVFIIFIHLKMSNI